MEATRESGRVTVPVGGPGNSDIRKFELSFDPTLAQLELWRSQQRQPFRCRQRLVFSGRKNNIRRSKHAPT